MKKLFTTLSFTLFFQFLFAQYNPDWVVPSADYQKTGVMMAVDSDNNVVLVGDRPSFAGAANIYTRKLDEQGNLLWEQVDTSGIHSVYEKAAWVNVDSLNNIYVCGYRYAGTSTNYADNIIALKYDAQGNLLWRKLFPDAFFGGLPMRSELDASGNFYIGTMNTSPPGFNLIKLDSGGNVLFNVSDSSTSNVSFSSMRIKDDKIVLSGYASLGSIACVVEFDTAGNFLWGNNYSTWGAIDLEIDSVYNIYFISRKENQVAGNTAYDVKLFKLNPNGTVAAEYNYDFGNSTDFVGRMTLVNGRISMTGWTIQSGSPYMNWLTLQTDLNGNELWHAVYNETIYNDEQPYWISAKTNGEVFVSGKGGPDTVSLTGSVYLRYVTLKYNNGQIQWVDADPYQGYTGIVNCIVPDGSLYVLGQYAMTAIHYNDNSSTTGFVDFQNEKNILIYPNPNYGSALLRINSPEFQNANISVFDYQGRITFRIDKIQLHKGINDVPLNFSNLQAGFYLGKLSFENTFKEFKVVVE